MKTKLHDYETSESQSVNESAESRNNITNDNLFSDSIDSVTDNEERMQVFMNVNENATESGNEDYEKMDVEKQINNPDIHFLLNMKQDVSGIIIFTNNSIPENLIYVISKGNTNNI
uniref:Uncharacterized protein n=1 Tax=Strongyloides venezuelensis TaxID=75913 RepID=A0A0K0F0X0_STRVS